MKIYNKSNFLLGLFFGLLCIAMLIVGIWKRFDIKGSIIMILCLFFGGVELSSGVCRLICPERIKSMNWMNEIIWSK